MEPKILVETQKQYEIFNKQIKVMKKFFIFFVAIFMMASMNAQSIQWHQSYDNNQKFVSDFFWNNDDFNVYSYNEFTVSNNQAVGYGIIYGEYRINKSHFLIHAESRFRTASFPTPMVPTAMYWPDNNLTNIGFVYELCLDNWVFNITPMYRWDFGKGSNWQFSINSSVDFEKFYYEGYLDTWGPDSFNLCTEQKFYYKIKPNVHIGVNLMLFNVNGNPTNLSIHGDGSWNFQPWLVARIAL